MGKREQPGTERETETERQTKAETPEGSRRIKVATASQTSSTLERIRLISVSLYTPNRGKRVSSFWVVVEKICIFFKWNSTFTVSFKDIVIGKQLNL